MPSHWEKFNHKDLEGNDIRYIHAEEFQIALWNETLYNNVKKESDLQLSNCNVVHDGLVIAEMYEMSMELSTTPQSVVRNIELTRHLKQLDYQYIFLDFNIFDTVSYNSDYFPINYDTILGHDFNYFEIGNYYGYFDPEFHGQGVVQYYEMPMVDDASAVKIFNDTYVNDLLEVDVDEEDEDVDFYESLSDAVFLYLYKMNDLS